MGTRSTIAKENPDGTITSIYCHWDGYPEGVGQTLAEHYTDSAKIDALIDLGDLSSLAPEIGERHDFDNPTEGWTLAYGRDRGEDEPPMTHPNVDTWKVDRYECGCEYGYLWMNGTTVWTIFNLSRSDTNE